MIDSIMTLVLREAMGRPGKDRVQSIYNVMKDIETAVQRVVDNIRLLERSKADHEKQG